MQRIAALGSIESTLIEATTPLTHPGRHDFAGLVFLDNRNLHLPSALSHPGSRVDSSEDIFVK
jgi:hypothetical protein